LVKQDIIEPVQGATDWLHPIVVVPKKDGAIRMCVDLTKLNKYIIRPTNPQPTPWEVVRLVPKGKKHFAVFDALKGYHQIELDKESRALTTFLTPFGRFRYKRLPMGESDAQDVFTLRYGAAVDASTEGRRSTEDTLLLGDTLQELLSNTEEFFKACDANGITLNTKKIGSTKNRQLVLYDNASVPVARAVPGMSSVVVERAVPASEEQLVQDKPSERVYTEREIYAPKLEASTAFGFVEMASADTLDTNQETVDPNQPTTTLASTTNAPGRTNNWPYLVFAGVLLTAVVGILLAPRLNRSA
jgi:hypothetical protein